MADRPWKTVRSARPSSEPRSDVFVLEAGSESCGARAEHGGSAGQEVEFAGGRLEGSPHPDIGAVPECGNDVGVRCALRHLCSAHRDWRGNVLRRDGQVGPCRKATAEQLLPTAAAEAESARRRRRASSSQLDQQRDYYAEDRHQNRNEEAIQPSLGQSPLALDRGH